MKKLFSKVSAAIALAFTMLVSLLSPVVAFAQPTPNCKVSIYFMTTDLAGKNIQSVPNKDSSVILYLKLSTSNDCNDTFNLGFLALNGTNFDNIGSSVSKTFNSTTKDLEYKLTWTISGLKDANTGQPVQNNGTVRFQAYAERQGYKVPSSTVDLAVKNETAKTGASSSTGSSSASVSSEGKTIIDNPLQSADDLLAFFFYLLNRALAFVGILATVMIVVGGYFMVVSAGNPNTRKKGRETILWAVIGLAITLLSFSIIAIVQNILRVK